MTKSGWKLVPAEPTTEMLEAGCNNMSFHDCVQPHSEDECRSGYRAMLAAAPPPPANIVADSPSAREVARPLEDWHEDMGDVLWWEFPVVEAPWVGSPLDSDWLGYHTHWTPLPAIPVPATPAEGGSDG